MTYESLHKIHYSALENHNSIYHARFNSPTTRHFDFNIREYDRQNEYPAFFCYTEEFALLTEEIYKKHERLLSILSKIPELVKKQFIFWNLVDEVRATSDIEGVHSTRREIQDVVIGATQSARFSSIVGKYKALLHFKQMNFQTCTDVRTFYDEFIHDEVIADNPNHKLDGDLFRKDVSQIFSASGKIIHQGTQEESRIIELLKIALKILNAENLPFFVRVSVFHYLFEYIHPFYDGNGRTARFIVSYFLARQFHVLIALRLSASIKRRKKKYYELFKLTDSEWNCGDLTPFVTGFTEIISATFDDINPPLENKMAQLVKYHDKLSTLDADDLTKKIYQILLETSVFFAQGVAMEDLMTLTGKSRNTVKSRLDSMPDNHLIKGNGKKIFYKLNMLMFKS